MHACPLLMTMKEAADRLGMHQLQLLRHVRAGRLRVSGQSVTGKMLFSEYQVEKFAYGLLIEPPAEDIPPTRPRAAATPEELGIRADAAIGDAA